jgi:hypothetical protein
MAEIDDGLADITARQTKDCDVGRIVEHGKKLLASRSSSA